MTLNRNETLLASAAAALLALSCGRDDPDALAGPADLGPGASAVTAQRTTHRSIEEFVAAQGTFCIPDPGGGCVIFVPPVANYIGWSDPDRLLGAAVDYAGLANQWIEQESGGTVSFGTSLRGTVTERTLQDGRALVHVTLHTEHALSFAVAECEPQGESATCDFASDPLVLGARAPDVLQGATPAFGDSHLDVKFISTAPGAPLPDLLQLAFLPEPGQELLQIKFHASAEGVLHAAFGVAEGTRGRLAVQEIGLFNTGFHGQLSNGFSAEFVKLHPLGH